MNKHRTLSNEPTMMFSSESTIGPQNVSDRLYKHVARVSQDWELNDILEHLMVRMEEVYPDLDPDSAEFVDLALCELF